MTHLPVPQTGILHPLQNQPSSLQRLGCLFDPAYRQDLLDRLIVAIDWQRDYLAFGRRFDVPRLQAWYADEGVHYRHADNLLPSHLWIPALSEIRHEVEARTRERFNSVLVTYYRDGHDHLTWHADDEPELGDAPVIASLSLGATRQFQYRTKPGGEARALLLHDGDLLLMRPGFQRYWQHAVPMEPEILAPRINLTFRRVVMRR